MTWFCPIVERSDVPKRPGFVPQCDEPFLCQVPPKHLWVEGDNHAVSMDSNTLGPVPMKRVGSKIISIVWPLSRMGRVSTVVTENSEGRLTRRPNDYEEEEERL